MRLCYMSERSKLQFFVKSDKQLRDRPWQKALSLQLKAPDSMEIYIFLLLRSFVIYWTSWENTTAKGTLVLSLTCMTFLYEECIGSAFTVLYFRWIMLFYRDKRYFIDTISIFKTQLAIVKNSNHKESISIASLVTWGYSIFDLKASKWTTCHCYGC